MEKNDVFVFTAPNGAECTAVVLETVEHSSSRVHICYGQNRLFTYIEESEETIVPVGVDEFGDDILVQNLTTKSYYGKVIAEYAVLPDYDSELENVIKSEQHGD